MKPTLVDTDILSFYLRGLPKVTQRFADYLQAYACINISIITEYEIRKGLLHRDAKGKLNSFELFVSMNQVLPITTHSVNQSAYIVASLRKRGIQMSDTDALIAGIALQNNLVLATNNTDDYKNIPGLELDNWSIWRLKTDSQIDMEVVKQPFSNAQLELLKAFSHNLSESELAELKKMLAQFFAQRAIKEANRIWDEKGWTEGGVERMLQQKMRTPKKKAWVFTVCF